MRILSFFLCCFIYFNSSAQSMQQGGGCVSWNLPPTTLCSSQNVFNLNGGMPTGGTYSGPGVFDGLFFPSFAGAGVHTITYTVNNGNCSGSATATIEVITPEPIMVSGDFEICMGESTTITALNGNDVEWSDNSTGQSATFAPQSTDLFVVYAYDDNNCLTSEEFTIEVNPLPNVFITGNTDVCIGNSTSLTANGIETFEWSVGGNSASVELSLVATTNICVTGADANGCVNTACRVVTVYDNPVFSITGDNEICIGQSTQLIAQGGSQYVWNTGSQSSSITVMPTANTTYSITGTDQYGCEGSASVQVSVYQNPVAAIIGDAVGCEQSFIVLEVAQGNDVLWSNGSSNLITNYILGEDETISVLVTNEFGCTDEAVITPNVFPLPEIDIEVNEQYCEGDTVMLQAMGNADWVWQDLSTADQFVFVATQTEVVYLAGTSDQGCTVVDSAYVNVNAAPDLTYTGNTTVCPGEEVSIEVTGSTDFQWSNGNMGSTYTYTPQQNEVITIVGASESGCEDVLTINIVVFEDGVVFIDGDNTPCIGDTIVYTAMGADTYMWSSGATSNSIEYIASADTTLEVIGMSALGCSAAATLQVVVSEFPNVIVDGNSQQCQGTELLLIAGGAQDYVWGNGGLNDTLVIVLEQDTALYVIGSNAAGCADTVYFEAQILPLPQVFFAFSQDTLCTQSGSIMLEATPAGGDFEGAGVSGNTMNAAGLPEGNTVVTYTYTNEWGCAATAADSVIVEICIGLENFDSASLVLYPNPVTDVLNVQLPGFGSINIYDANGKQVLVQNNASSFVVVPVQHLSAGLYTCTFVNMQGEVVQQKFQKL
jgi:Secretion system C-terminal sorting domain